MTRSRLIHQTLAATALLVLTATQVQAQHVLLAVDSRANRIMTLDPPFLAPSSTPTSSSTLAPRAPSTFKSRAQPFR